MSISTDGPASTGKKRGGPRRIDRMGIVEAAKRLEPEGITMKAVADELGVDPKALNYHVSSREGLLQLVAADAFIDSLQATVIPPSSTWEEAVVAFARSIRDSMAATGALVNYFRIDPGLVGLGPAEATLERLLDAGLDIRQGAGVLQHVTLVGLGMGRDLILQKDEGVHPQMPLLLDALGDEPADGDGFSALRAAAKDGPLAFGEAQFDFEMMLVVGGIASLLSSAETDR